ncbi:hypothetical protein [Mucilaginibacter sp.]|uniref:hypothetical protein n=1 Tax=Mucilaginibacter sp. TaxID=1882438 RepID=UPI0032666587
MDIIYSKSISSEERELIGSMYPQKFTFEELQHRTAFTSELYSCIYLINSKISGKKEGQATDFSCLPILAPQTWARTFTINSLFLSNFPENGSKNVQQGSRLYATPFGRFSNQFINELKVVAGFT